MVQPLGHRFDPPVPALPRAPAVAPIIGPPGFELVPIHAPLAPRIIAHPSPRIIVPVFHHHHPPPPPSLVQHPVAPIVALEALVPDPVEVLVATNADIDIPIAVDVDDQLAADDEDLLAAEDLPVEDLTAHKGEHEDAKIFIIDDKVHNADAEKDLELDQIIEEVIDGWDDPIVADPIIQDESQDGDSKINFEDYISDDPWQEEVNSSASDEQHDD